MAAEQAGYFISSFFMLFMFMFFVSLIFSKTAFKKLKYPKKQIYSVSLSYPLLAILFAYANTDGGNPNFIERFVYYGLVLCVFIVGYLTGIIKKRKGD